MISLTGLLHKDRHFSCKICSIQIKAERRSFLAFSSLLANRGSAFASGLRPFSGQSYSRTRHDIGIFVQSTEYYHCFYSVNCRFISSTIKHTPIR